MATDSRRLSILSAQEIEGLYGLPRFTEDDRQVFFDLSPVEREVVDAVHAISTAVQLTLQLGYFKARRQFFVYTREAVLDDLEHSRGRYFPAREIADIKWWPRRQARRNAGHHDGLSASVSTCRRSSRLPDH